MKNQYKWNLEYLLADESVSTISKKRKQIIRENNKFIAKWQKRKDYIISPEVLAEALFEYERLNRKFSAWGNEAYYYYLKSEISQNDPEIKAKYRNVEEFATKISNQLKFFELNIAKIDSSKQKTFLKFQGLAPYKHFLEKLFLESKHLLSEPEEKILSLKSTVAYKNWSKLTAGFLSSETREIVLEKGKRERKSFSEILSLMKNDNKIIRDSAAVAFNDILRKFEDVAEAEINSVLLNKKIDDELRGFKKPEYSRFLSDDIAPEIVESMLSAVSDHFGIPKQYYKLKAQLLGLKKLEYHERNVAYGRVEKNIDFDRAVSVLRKTFSRLDVEFSKTLDSFLEKRLIDVCPAKGKREGAFCMMNLLTEPTFVLLNYTGTTSDVSTFAHEMGHAINNELMKKSQNSLNFGNTLAVAEVASTFMEDFVLKEMQNESSDELKLSLMMTKLDGDVGSIFRQVACVNFEKELHAAFRQKGYLSKKEIGQLFGKHMKSYMGNYVEQSKGSENWWIYWNHIRSYFYNYSYANGLLISKSLQSMVKNDQSAMEKVKKILSSGLSKSPKEIFAEAGIDLTDEDFWNQGLKEVEELLGQAKLLAKKLGKI